MRKKLQLIASLSLLAFSFNGYSQQRYLTEVYSNVTVTSNVIYGNNISVLSGTPTPADITMDVYEATGDTATARPLVLVLHTGSFLPAVYNGQPTGDKTDSAVVEMCMRFAKKGYVAIAPNYRIGWNPISNDQDIRTGTLLQAVYRAIQDAKNCVRYFKNDRATANTFKIDTTKIAVGGLGSGGYIALAYGSLNLPAELTLGKFIDNSANPPHPYIIQSVFGNFDGTDSTQLNLPNYANHSSTVQMIFNVGGAIGDISWINAGEAPVVGLQCTHDANAPYTYGAVIVPSTGNFVVNASGSHDVIAKEDSTYINNNLIFHNSLFTDAYSTQANAINGGLEGLYPFITPAPGANLSCTGASANAQTEQGAPWDWWDGTVYANASGHPPVNGTVLPGSVYACLALRDNPDMSAIKGRAYIDTIQGYVTPRMVCALGLPGCTPNPAGVNEHTSVSELNLFPNPATASLNVVAKGNTIQTIEVVDVAGRIVKQANVNASEYTIQRDGLNSGVYFAKVKLAKGNIVTKRIIFE